MVGAARFELATPSPPDWCANRAALRSENRPDYSEGRPAAQLARAAEKTYNVYVISAGPFPTILDFP
jgi:hypothetical protein